MPIPSSSLDSCSGSWSIPGLAVHASTKHKWKRWGWRSCQEICIGISGQCKGQKLGLPLGKSRVNTQVCDPTENSIPVSHDVGAAQPMHNLSNRKAICRLFFLTQITLDGHWWTSSSQPKHRHTGCHLSVCRIDLSACGIYQLPVWVGIQSVAEMYSREMSQIQVQIAGSLLQALLGGFCLRIYLCA